MSNEEKSNYIWKLLAGKKDEIIAKENLLGIRTLKKLYISNKEEGNNKIFVDRQLYRFIMLHILILINSKNTTQLNDDYLSVSNMHAYNITAENCAGAMLVNDHDNSLLVYININGANFKYKVNKYESRLVYYSSVLDDLGVSKL